MEIGISALLVILTILINVTLFIQLKNRKNTQLEMLIKESDELEDEFKHAQARLAQLKEEKGMLEEKLIEEKKKLEDEANTPIYTPEVDPEEILLKEKIVTPDQLKKAKDYIKRNSVNLSIVDSLLLLNTIDSDTATYVKNKIKELQQPVTRA